MSKRALSVGILTAGLSAGILATAISPAAAQGNPVGGSGNGYYLTGAGNNTGQPVYAFAYGNPNDEVYFGNFAPEGTPVAGVYPAAEQVDEALVRRGNSFIIRGTNDEIFVYGDKGDTILVGDWNGDGVDTLAVRRKNHYLIRNDLKTGYSTQDFHYGNDDDNVMVGNWDGAGGDINGDGDKTDTLAGSWAGTTITEATATTDTLMVRRANHFYVKNDLVTGDAEYHFYYGNSDDSYLAGDWAKAPVWATDVASTTGEGKDESKQYAADNKTVVGPKVKTSGENSDGKDQLAIKRGNLYLFSDELSEVKPTSPSAPVGTLATPQQAYFGEASDVAFVAQRTWTYNDNSAVVGGKDFAAGDNETLSGDGIGLRRVLG
ncbi:hypothetical protein GCU56_22920 [Geodermatophilus sabuli]|uniref:Uncharacterized protein n=1 Tax=Geodermatophilus sabuli TaxID=1564158 RepID=A0A7K3W782_9ACTN|nr:hypothetical protein [Geodermatophilus sabuli]NEK60706.1 hypothetical protein [Geodermatophilus sabuli]